MTDQHQQILSAVQNDDVLALADIKVDPAQANQWRDINDRGLLHHAVHNRCSMAVQWMIDHWSMDPDPRDNQGETPLMRAACLGDIASMETLLAAGADPNAQARTGGSALHYAYSGDAMRAVDVLKKAGANIDAVDASGRKAEDWAAQAAQIKQGAMMLKKLGAPPRRGTLKLSRKG